MFRRLLLIARTVLTVFTLMLMIVAPNARARGSHTPVPADSDLAQAGAGRVRVVHAVPGGPNVDVRLNNSIPTAFSDIAFREVTAYISPGDACPYDIEILDAGTATVLVDATLKVEAGTDVTILVTNFPEDIEAVIVPDDNSPPQPGMAKIRVVHASPNTPVVDIVAGGTVLLGAVPFKGVSTYGEVPPGTYANLEIRAAGTTRVIQRVPAITLAANEVHTIFATGLMGHPLDIVASVDNTGDPRIRVMHAALDAPNIDVKVNGTPPAAFVNIAFEGMTDYISPVGPGTYAVEVVETGTETLLAEARITLQPDRDATIVVVDGTADDGSIDILTLLDNNNVPDEDMAKVRFVHTAPDLGEIDIVDDSGQQIVSNLTFQKASPYASVAANTDLIVRAGLLSAELDADIDEGNVYTIFVTGSLLTLNTVMRVDNTGDPRIRVVHAAPDAPDIDVRVDDSLPSAFADIPFGTVTGYITPGGPQSYDIAVVPAGQDPPTIVAESLELQPDTDYTIIVTGLHEDKEILFLEDNNIPPGTFLSRVRIIHAAPDVPLVDVAVAGGEALLEDVPFKGVSSYAQVPATTISNLEVREAGTEEVITPVPPVTLESGRVHTIFAVGLLHSLDTLLTTDSRAGSSDPTDPGAPDDPSDPDGPGELTGRAIYLPLLTH